MKYKKRIKKTKKTAKLKKKSISKKESAGFHIKMIGSAREKQTSSEKVKAVETRVDNLLKKGRLRGFITHAEILKEFPLVEEDVVFLDVEERESEIDLAVGDRALRADFKLAARLQRKIIRRGAERNELGGGLGGAAVAGVEIEILGYTPDQTAATSPWIVTLFVGGQGRGRRDERVALQVDLVAPQADDELQRGCKLEGVFQIDRAGLHDDA